MNLNELNPKQKQWKERPTAGGVNFRVGAHSEVRCVLRVHLRPDRSRNAVWELGEEGEDVCEADGAVAVAIGQGEDTVVLVALLWRHGDAREPRGAPLSHGDRRKPRRSQGRHRGEY